MVEYPAISIRQPWASLVTLGLKPIEIRSWSTEYRGCLLIHASRAIDDAAARRLQLLDLPVGCLIGSVRLTKVERFTPEMWYATADAHLDPGPYRPGLYAWYFEQPTTLNAPLPCNGKLGVFPVSVPDALMRGVTSAKLE